MAEIDDDGIFIPDSARDSWVESLFDDADINKDGFLDESESLKLLTVSFHVINRRSVVP